jgi:hypothetical protein
VCPLFLPSLFQRLALFLHASLAVAVPAVLEVHVVEIFGDGEYPRAVLAFFFFGKVFSYGSYLFPAKRECFELFLFTGSTDWMWFIVYNKFFTEFFDRKDSMAFCAFSVFFTNCFYGHLRNNPGRSIYLLLLKGLQLLIIYFGIKPPKYQDNKNDKGLLKAKHNLQRGKRKMNGAYWICAGCRP